MKFSTRELLLVTVIVALAVGWAVDRWALVAREEKSRHDAEVLAKVVCHNVCCLIQSMYEFGITPNLAQAV